GWWVGAVAAPDGGSTWQPEDAAAVAPASSSVVSVSDFGAIPNDGVDDTAAIQRAIDALPRSGGPVGGLVLFPAGRFNTVRPIQLPSGVWLRGQGNATSIYNTGFDRSRGTIEFIGSDGQPFNVGAGIEDLGIYTAVAAGIRSDASITSGLIDAHLSDLVIS